MGSRSDHGLAQAAAQALQTAADAVVELDAAIAQGNAAEQRGIGAAGQAVAEKDDALIRTNQHTKVNSFLNCSNTPSILPPATLFFDTFFKFF